MSSCHALCVSTHKEYENSHFHSISEFLYSLSDINECTKGTENCTDGCVNTEGSYYCTCPGGYGLKSDNNTCVGELMSKYLFTTLEFRITKLCIPKELLLQKLFQITLLDIDECTKDMDNCTDGCVNTEGSYYCTCPGGYELTGNNRTCVGE